MLGDHALGEMVEGHLVWGWVRFKGWLWPFVGTAWKKAFADPHATSETNTGK